MQETLDLKNVVENIISSYESRIESINSISDTAYLLLNDFQKSILDTKEEREKINSQLRDILARNGNLRKKDFDSMMQSVFMPQEEKENEIKFLLGYYLKEQKGIASALKDNFAKIKEALAKGDTGRIKDLLDTVKKLLARQDKRKKGLTLKLEELHTEEEDAVTKVKVLLVKGRELHLEDFKKMISEIRQKRKERIEETQKRQEGVRDMLAGFKKQRLEVAKKRIKK